MPKPVSQTPPLATSTGMFARLDVLMDESARVRLAQRPRERNPDAQELRDSQRFAEQTIENRHPQGPRSPGAEQLRWRDGNSGRLHRPATSRLALNAYSRFESVRHAGEPVPPWLAGWAARSLPALPRYSVKSPSLRMPKMRNLKDRSQVPARSLYIVGLISLFEP